MNIRVGELRNDDVIALLEEHHEDMLSHSPPESVHALDITALEKSDVTFFSLWTDHQIGNQEAESQELAGVGALKEIDKTHGEIKSMRTSIKHLRKGVARQLLEHIINLAKVRSYKKLSLETGSMPAFLPAKNLYEELGFQECEPFGNYNKDPYSTFMTKIIE